MTQEDDEMVSYRVRQIPQTQKQEKLMQNRVNILLITIVTATFLMSASTSFAQDDGYGPGKRGQRGMQGMPVVEQLMHALHRLELGDEQRASIRAVMQEMKSEIRPLMGEMKASHLQLKELVKADEYDEDAVATLAAKEGDLAAERVVITSRALSEVYGYLTDEQRVELEEMAAQREERRDERRKQRSGDS
jgi:protein CpxP